MSMHFLPPHFVGVVVGAILSHERSRRPARITLKPSQYRDVTQGDDDPTPPAAPAALPARLAA